MGERRYRNITAAVYEAVRAGCAAAGLDREYFNGDDILRLWNRGLSVADIVKTAVAHAQRTGDREGVPAP